MKIGVYARTIHKEHETYVRSFFDFLSDQNVELCIHRALSEALEQMGYNHSYHVFSDSVVNEHIEILFSLGGDGTVLDTLRLVRDSGTPVLGINLGRFGFLAHSQQEDFAATFELIKNKSYTIDPRTVVELESDIDLFDGFPFGLNDFIVHKKDSSSMITVHTYLDGSLLNSYWADGLIVATPTGSTGYSLSCGGPIVFPGSSSLVITPIAPHNLSLRPLIIGDSKNISFDIEGRTDDFLVTMDSRSVSVRKGTKLHVKKADFEFNMIKLEGHNHITTLRNKLMWGIDKRN